MNSGLHYMTQTVTKKGLFLAQYQRGILFLGVPVLLFQEKKKVDCLKA